MTSPLLEQIAATRIPRATDKLVLVMLTINADNDGQAGMAIVDLLRVTSLNRKTILSAIHRLRADGWLTDNGERRGVTRSVPVYLVKGPGEAAATPTQPQRQRLMPVRLTNAIGSNRLTAETEAVPDMGPLSSPDFNPPSGPCRPETGPASTVEAGPVSGLLPPSRSTENLSFFLKEGKNLYILPTPVQPINPIPTTTREAEISEPRQPQTEPPLTLTPADPVSVSAPKPKRAAPRPKAALTPIPETWEPSEKGLEFAAKHGSIAAHEAPRFVAHHQAKGSVMASWDAAWRTWCLNQERWRKEDLERARGVTAKEVARGERYQASTLRTSL